jgi:hypothetical protein
MAIVSSLSIVVDVICDGTSTTLTVDLNAAPVILAADVQTHFTFGSFHPKSVFSISSQQQTGVTGSVSGSMLTVTYKSAPTGTDQLSVVLGF